MGKWTGTVIVRNRIFGNAGRVQDILLIFSVIKIVFRKVTYLNILFDR